MAAAAGAAAAAHDAARLVGRSPCAGPHARMPVAAAAGAWRRCAVDDALAAALPLRQPLRRPVGLLARGAAPGGALAGCAGRRGYRSARHGRLVAAENRA